MELIQLPKPMRLRGFTGWPEVYRVSADEAKPPPGISYVVAEEVDFALLFRLMVPILEKQHEYFDWSEIYESLIGGHYYAQRVYVEVPLNDEGLGYEYDVNGLGTTTTLTELACDDATYVDLDILAELAMIPTFMSDIHDAITINVTNSYQWQDGFNKKTGICTGSLIEQPHPRSLVILDISGSIPDGVSAGMLTLIKTITDVVNSDLIITGSTSKFYTKDEAMKLDIHKVRAECGFGNEGVQFWEILETHDMNYENVITFGDSDHPADFVRHNQMEEEFHDKVDVKRWYSFFCMEHDTYGNGYLQGAGYGRWVLANCPEVEVIHKTDWARFFVKKGRQW